MSTPPIDHATLPYRIAVLCYLYTTDDHVLLLHRAQAPNEGMHSPIGGKLDVRTGESPHQCAAREIEEEAGLRLALDELRLTGIVSETAYEGQTHWLIFLFEAMRPIDRAEVSEMNISEGALEWVRIDEVAALNIPETDRRFMWPLVQEHRSGFFQVHIDCRDGELKSTLVESIQSRQQTTDSKQFGAPG